MTELPQHLCRPRLRRWEACEYLALVHGLVIAKTTMAKLACVGGGPPFNKVGKTPLYPVEQLDDWAAKRIGPLLKSTSDAGDGAE